MKRWLSGITPGTVRAVLFAFLIGIAIAIWIYTQLIFKEVREFQKSVARIQIGIYVGIIEPSATDVNSLFDLVKDSPLPRIITDKDLNPIQGLWLNVPIPPDSLDKESSRKLRSLVRKMDRTNPPVTFYMPRSAHYTDSLTVYELPVFNDIPVVVTDTLGTYLYSRNLKTDPGDKKALRLVLEKLDTFMPPVEFEKPDQPPLQFHGIDERQIWPMLIVKKSGEPLYWNNLNIARNDTTLASRDRLEAFAEIARSDGVVYDLVVSYTVLERDTWLFHYGDVPFLTWIAWLPVIEFAVLLILLMVGLIGFRNITNAEQRSIWVGMAKETAHQLGTPISSLSGWLELLKSDREAITLDQTIPEMEYDVERLTRVAARFSSIGSKPELQPIVLSDVIEEVLEYYRSRVPRMGSDIVLEGRYSGLRNILGNHELLNWAFENLVKNSLAAIESKHGRIKITGSMSKDFKYIILDFKDNGKGIPSANQKKVMNPGFTTKKRGWGLGLSLVKRIIEDYHNGTVFLSGSKPGAGTTFRVILPAVADANSLSNRKNLHF